MACHTQKEIAAVCGCSQQTADDQLKVLPKRFLETKSVKSAADHATQFDPPIYNIWKQQTKSEDNNAGERGLRRTDLRHLQEPSSPALGRHATRHGSRTCEGDL